MKFYLVLSVLFSLVVFTASCTINVNQPANNTNINRPSNAVNTASTSASKAHWSVVVCTSRAKNLNFSAGPNENDSETFATWKEGSTQKVFNLPERVQNLSSVYFMASGSDKNQVELCVLYDGRPKKRVEFDDSEDNIINSGDADDKECRCVE